MVTWIKSTGFHTWIAESTGWFPYPTCLAVHSMGMGIIVGVGVVLGLRLLGVAPDLPLPPLKRLFSFMWFGLLINAISGIGLTFTDPDKLLNWMIWLKFIFLALALVTTRMIQTQVFANPHPEEPLAERSRTLALLSIIFWAGVITAGRLSAYLGFS